MKDIENGMLCDWYWRDFEGTAKYGTRRKEEDDDEEDIDADSEAAQPAGTARDCAGTLENQEVET